MAKQASKKTVHEADSKGKLTFASPLTGEYVENAPVPTNAPVVEQAEDDTDIGKKINDVIEREYPRTRIGTDGWLQAILCELIRARLSK